MIAQTNINQAFSLAEHFPTNGRSVSIPHCFQGLFEVSMQDSKYHKVIFLDMSCPLYSTK